MNNRICRGVKKHAKGYYCRIRPRLAGEKLQNFRNQNKPAEIITRLILLGVGRGGVPKWKREGKRRLKREKLGLPATAWRSWGGRASATFQRREGKFREESETINTGFFSSWFSVFLSFYFKILRSNFA